MTVTSANIHEWFSYDPETGILSWKKRQGRWGIVPSEGKEVGWLDNHGYRRVEVDARKRMVHEVIWFMQTGNWSNEDVDHWDLDRQNNQWGNLREATRSDNMGNIRAQANNKLGLKGVSFDKRTQKFQAVINRHGTRIHLGYSMDPQELHERYERAAQSLFGTFARTA